MEESYLFLGLILLSAASLVLTQQKHGQDYSFCSSPPTAPVGTPSFKAKPTISNQFHVHVECVIKNKNLTTDIDEYFDDINNRGFVKQIDEGTEFDAWYDYGSNEFIGFFPAVGYNGQCFVQDLSKTDQRFLFGYSQVSGKPHIFSAAGALHFGGKGVSEVYMGQTTVRGIAVDWWSSCQYWQDMDATMYVDWYFTSQAYWSTAVGLEVPIRAHVRGVIYDTPTSQSRPFDHYYEFFHYRPTLTTNDMLSAFETPRQVQCPGRKNTRPLPTLPQDAFSFITEIIDNRRNVISFMKESFDFTDKLVKFEFRPLISDNNPYGTNDLVEIHDYHTGVAYITDQMLGNCTYKKIETGEFDDRTLADGHSVRIRTANEFFYFDNTKYTYEGIKTNRWVNCDTWVGLRNDFPAAWLGWNSTWEWYFAADPWRVTNPGPEAGGIPLQMRVNVQNQLSFDYNIYQFKKDKPDLLKFDVSACYTFLNRRKFQFKLPGSAIPVVDANLELFKYFVLISIIGNTGVSPIRVAHLRVYFATDIIVAFELLDVAPIKGDVQSAANEVPLDFAANTLTTMIQSGQFVIEMDNDNFGDLKKLVAKQNSIVETTYLNTTVYQTIQQQQSSNQYTPGHMAAVGLTMPVVGAGLGVVFAYFFFK